MSDVNYKVEIKQLYKIFGNTPHKMLEKVYAGVSKEELHAQYGHVLGLKDINLSIKEKSIQVIMGLSGSGKSTLIRHLNRLIEPTAGAILISGENVLEMGKVALRSLRRHQMAMVFQRFALLPHRTVQDNIAYGLNIKGEEKASVQCRTALWIERVGLSGFEKHYPEQLSGGMQQRVGLARALATDADILLMDEAFSALDPLIRTEMQDILLSLQKELHKTIIFITHDLEEALRIGDRIAVLRDGEIIQQGTPQQIVMEPADEYISDFTRDINRGRVLTLNSIMSAPKVHSGVLLSGQMLVENAANALVDKGCMHARVIDENHKVVGQVDVNDVLRVLGRPVG